MSSAPRFRSRKLISDTVPALLIRAMSKPAARSTATTGNTALHASAADGRTQVALSAGGRPAALDTVAFTLELLKRIPRAPRKASTTELCAQLQAAGFDRDVRTVQRQLDEISQRFAIERDERSKPYGYCWKREVVGLSVPGLTETESLVLALAEGHLKALLPPVVIEGMRPFFEQARSQLARSAEQPPAQRQVADWMRKVRVVSTSQPLLAPSVAAGVFEAVSRALWRDEWLDIVYTNAAGHTVEARVMPLGLAQQGERLYVVCRFEGHDNERSLAVHRIATASETGLPFQRPAEFDLASYDNAGRFAFGEGKLVTLDIRIAKPAGLHLLESKLAADQQVTEVGDCYRIRARVTQTARLTWWLRGFGDEVTVLAPVTLARAVHPHRVASRSNERSTPMD